MLNNEGKILWERGVISRKAADASLQYFLHYESSGSVTPLILSKEHIRSIHDAYQHDKNASMATVLFRHLYCNCLSKFRTRYPLLHEY